MSLFSFFKKKTISAPVEELRVDIHSHLIPAIDDGIQSVEEGLTILREFEALGYEKVITTPHTMWGTYDNSRKNILEGLSIMQKAAEEAGFINEPPALKDASFQLNMHGYKMVYAHPERYMYLLQNERLIEELLDRNIIFQLNAISLTGCYSKPVQKLAEKLIDMKAIQLVGSDCHNMGHINLLNEAKKSKYWNKLLQLDLLNNKL